MKIISTNSTVTQKELVEQLGKSERTIKTRTVELQEKGYICRTNGKTSNDVVGVLNTNKGVCEGFTKLLKSLCDEVGIKILYKNSYVKETLDYHGNAEIYIEDKNGKKHCLHCDPTIDCCKTDEDVLKYNAMLIVDSDINRYYHTQTWGSNVGFYSNFFYGEGDINIGISDMDKMMAQMREVYRNLYQCYQEAQVPIDNNEFVETLINVQIAKLMNRGLSFYEAQRKGKEIIKERMKKSIEAQKEFWNNENGNSFMFDIVNGKFDFENMLVNRQDKISVEH